MGYEITCTIHSEVLARKLIQRMVKSAARKGLHCDVSRDEASKTVTFWLTRADDGHR